MSAPFVAPPLSELSLSKAGEDVIDRIVALYEKSEDPVVLVDACASRFGMENVVRKLVEQTDMTFYETPMVSLIFCAAEFIYHWTDSVGTNAG